MDDDQLIKMAMAGAFLTSYCAARGVTEVAEAALDLVEDAAGAAVDFVGDATEVLQSIRKDPLGALLKTLGVEM